MVVINITTQASYSIILLLAVVSTARLFMSLPLVFPPTTAPVTKSGDTMLGLAVRKGQFDIIKYLVTECSVSVNGEQSVFILDELFDHFSSFEVLSGFNLHSIVTHVMLSYLLW